MLTLAVPSELVRIFVEAIQDLQFEGEAHIENLWVKGHYDAVTGVNENDHSINLWSPVVLLNRPHLPPPYKPPPP